MSSLSALINHSPRLQQPLLVVQSCAAASGLPILRQLLTQRAESNTRKTEPRFLLFCLLYRPSALVDADSADVLDIHDRTGHVLGYQNSEHDLREEILLAVRNAPSGPLSVVIDSVNTLSSDIGSISQTLTFLRQLLALIQIRSNPSCLILHVLQPSELIPHLTQTAFSSSLSYLITHPPALLTHLTSDYFTPPPPASPAAKFWSIFIPISERGYDGDNLVFGPEGEGGGGGTELVVEMLIRGSVDGYGKRRGVERLLEGWSSARGGACELTQMDSLKSVWTKKAPDEDAPDPTKNLSFNLAITSSQQQSRAQVPLPYAHEGKPQVNPSSKTPGVIHYDPDSGDDIDDDDPDEDLDI